jgi:hypothetical protein
MIRKSMAASIANGTIMRCLRVWVISYCMVILYHHFPTIKAGAVD